MKKTISLILILMITLGVMFSLASCTTTEPDAEPVVTDEFKGANILFLEYTVRYSSGSGNAEYIVVGYTLPNDNTLHTENVRVEHVVFVKENIAEIRLFDTDAFYRPYLYINEAKFLELLK